MTDSITTAEHHENGGLRMQGVIDSEPTSNGATGSSEKSQIDVHAERRIVRKIDFHLVPILAVLYLLAFLDRANIGNASIAGMYEDLELYGLKYNTAVSVFFVTYVVFEVPSNIVLKLIRPSIWMTILCFSWGLVMTLMGLVTTYEGLVTARVFLGVAEAGFFPAATYLLTIWYKPYELQKRVAIFYTASSVAGAFSGLLAFAIEKMAGVGGLSAWNWIFIIEGLVPIAVSFGLYWLLPDSPETAKFLTEGERALASSRLNLHTIDGTEHMVNSDKISIKHVKAAFADTKIWLSVIPYWASSIGAYGFTATVPTAIRQMGYTSAQAQLMTIPIYTFAVIVTLSVAYFSDRAQQRTPFIIGGLGMAAIGFIGELAVPHPQLPGVAYFFLFLVAAGLFSPFPSILALAGNNIAPSSKRAVGLALLISIGNAGGICGSNIFLARQAPKYPLGYGVCLGACLAGIVAAATLRLMYARENRLRANVIQYEVKGGSRNQNASHSEQEALAMGDDSPFFRYTL